MFISFNLHNKPRGRLPFQFTEDRTKAPRDWVFCPKVTKFVNGRAEISTLVFTGLKTHVLGFCPLEKALLYFYKVTNGDLVYWYIGKILKDLEKHEPRLTIWNCLPDECYLTIEHELYSICSQFSEWLDSAFTILILQRPLDIPKAQCFWDQPCSN